jgi:hydrogenase maturation protein HypF
MESMNFPVNIDKCMLALGPESDGNFSFFHKGVLYRSDSLGDLLSEENFQNFTRAVEKFLKDNRAKPDIILTDLHPLYKTTILGESLSKKYKARHVKIQHHISHIFSTIGNRLLEAKGYKLKATSYGIACDGTGYGLDGKIWGGEVFRIKIKNQKSKIKIIERIGHLENQVLIGGDLAIKEPARMLISILSKFLPKSEVYRFVKKYYSKNKFEVLYSQLKQNFNCQETSSAGRILDAVSVLLGFSGNVRKYKHSPAIALENNSTIPYADLKPVVMKSKINSSGGQNSNFMLETTPLFEYLVKNINGDKHRLAATAQFYIAQGLYEILRPKTRSSKLKASFFSGGIANNKIIASYLKRKGVYASKKIPRGDAGVSFGQIIYYLLADSRD